MHTEFKTLFSQMYFIIQTYADNEQKFRSHFFLLRPHYIIIIVATNTYAECVSVRIISLCSRYCDKRRYGNV